MAVTRTFLFLGALLAGSAQDELPVLLNEDFEKGADRWEPTDDGAWKVLKTDAGSVYSLHKRRSNYKPPHRSPLNISLLKEVFVGDFVLEAKVKSTIPEYGHRDMCLFFGYQDSAHFYYVHFGKKMDNHANQIFIVNEKPRTKISTKTTEGTPWTDAWHRLKLERKVSDGSIKVYFDDMKNPVMTATDKTFPWGRIGLGSFDDTGDWDDVKLRGVKVKSGN